LRSSSSSLRTSACLIATIAALLGAGSCQREQVGSSKTVVTIGAVLPLTGDVASYGKDSSDGINLGIERANQRSAKYTYRVVYQDSKGQGAEAVAAAQKLLSVDKAVAIIGDNVSGPTVAMVPFTDAARTPVISPSASTPKLSGMSKYFFRVYPSDTAEGSFMADVAANRLGVHQVAILYINNDFGVGLRDVFGRDFTAKGGKIVSVQGYNEDQTDFRPYLARVKQDRPDAVYLAGYYKDGGAILKQAKEMGVDAKFLGSTTHEDPQLIQIAKGAADGLFYPYSTGYDASSTAVAVRTFKTAFHEKYKRAPGLVAALGYDCARLIIDAVEYGGPSRQGIRDFLARTSNYDGATGRMAFDANGDVHKPVLLKTVRNGQFVNL
jgi:branched-chain amino acid transport system substrate-binding protein